MREIYVSRNVKLSKKWIDLLTMFWATWFCVNRNTWSCCLSMMGCRIWRYWAGSISLIHILSFVLLRWMPPVSLVFSFGAFRLFFLISFLLCTLKYGRHWSGDNDFKNNNNKLTLALPWSVISFHLWDNYFILPLIILPTPSVFTQKKIFSTVYLYTFMLCGKELTDVRIFFSPFSRKWILDLGIWALVVIRQWSRLP